MNISTIIVDDEPLNIKFLQKMVKDYCPDLEVVATATTVDEAIKVIICKKPDLLLLDIQLHNKDCFDILSCIDTSRLCIILVSAHNNYGPKVVDYLISGYLLKPLRIEELVTSVNKVKDTIAKRDLIPPPPTHQMISLSDKSFMKFKPIAEVTFFEAHANYTRIHTFGGETYLTSKNLKEYESNLPSFFVRVSRSFIINTTFVEALSKTKEIVVMKDNTQIALKQNAEKLVSLLTRG